MNAIEVMLKLRDPGIRSIAAVTEINNRLENGTNHHPQKRLVEMEFRALDTSGAETPSVSKLLVATKAHDATSAIVEMLPYCQLDAQIVLCHNGLGTIECISPLLGTNQELWAASTTHGAMFIREKDQEPFLRQTGHGLTWLGPVNTAAKSSSSRLDIERDMNTALGPVEVTDNIMGKLWQKLAINAVINPLTAIHNVRNGELAHDRFTPQITALIEETSAIIRREGFAEMTEDFIRKLVYEVIQRTSLNYSSMHQDCLYARRTEIDAINGHLVRVAEKHGTRASINEGIVASIKHLSLSSSQENKAS
jgi:2-dehydropantoate 2-reductase